MRHVFHDVRNDRKEDRFAEVALAHPSAKAAGETEDGLVPAAGGDFREREGRGAASAASV